MKIYCSRRHGANIEDFIGKDIWVKCRLSDFRLGADNKFWVKFNAFYNDNIVSINAIKVGDAILQRELYRLNSPDTLYFRRHNIKIIQPVDMLTTEELREMCLSNAERLIIKPDAEMLE